MNNQPAHSSQQLDMNNQPAHYSQQLDMNNQPAHSSQQLEMNNQLAQSSQQLDMNNQPAHSSQQLDMNNQPAQSSQQLDMNNQPAQSSQQLDMNNQLAQSSQLSDISNFSTHSSQQWDINRQPAQTIQQQSSSGQSEQWDETPLIIIQATQTNQQEINRSQSTQFKQQAVVGERSAQDISNQSGQSSQQSNVNNQFVFEQHNLGDQLEGIDAQHDQLTNDQVTLLSEKQLRGRKRKRLADSWKDRQRSKQYNNGNEKRYKKQVMERKVRTSCGLKCNFKCMDNFKEEVRDSIHKSFWSLGNQLRRRDFLVSNVIRVNPIRKSTCRRQHSIAYTLPNGLENIRVRVCKKFFLGTLDVSDKMVYYSLSNSEHGVVKEKSYTGRRKCPVEHYDYVCAHINSFPRVESHYCRAGNAKQYLDSQLTVSEMYRLYQQKCAESQREAVKHSMYRFIFDHHFNLAFHKPKKDTCDSCTAHEALVEANEVTEEKTREHEAHLRRKEQAREAKTADKQTNPDYCVVAAFDLEQVLVCPRLTVGSAYYLRKLNVYNLTIFELQTKQGHCFIWNESEGRRGSNEIASALWQWLVEIDRKGVKKVVLYSDTCGGQNRNRYLCTAISYFLSQSTSITRIEQKFFESGHSESECDSMHSCMERRLKNCPVHLPSEYARLAKRAVLLKPYMVHELSYSDFIKFESINSSCIKSTAFNGILSTHHIVYDRNNNGFVAIFFAGEISGQLIEKPYMRKNCQSLQQVSITAAYNDRLPIDKDKKNDLIKLCQFLPADCRSFYQNLPGSTLVDNTTQSGTVGHGNVCVNDNADDSGLPLVSTPPGNSMLCIDGSVGTSTLRRNIAARSVGTGKRLHSSVARTSMSTSADKTSSGTSQCGARGRANVSVNDNVDNSILPLISTPSGNSTLCIDGSVGTRTRRCNIAAGSVSTGKQGRSIASMTTSTDKISSRVSQSNTYNHVEVL